MYAFDILTQEERSVVDTAKKSFMESLMQLMLRFH